LPLADTWRLSHGNNQQFAAADNRKSKISQPGMATANLAAKLTSGNRPSALAAR